MKAVPAHKKYYDTHRDEIAARRRLRWEALKEEVLTPEELFYKRTILKFRYRLGKALDIF